MTSTPPTDTDSSRGEARYLIRKRGMFYRPNAQGYTNSVAEAGRYTLADAIAYSHPNGPDGPRDGITYAHESEWSAQTERSGLAEELAALSIETHGSRLAMGEWMLDNRDRILTALSSAPAEFHMGGAAAALAITEPMQSAPADVTRAHLEADHEGE